MPAPSSLLPAPPDAAPVSGSPLPAAILDAARRVLLDEGVDGLSMRRLAREIGYSPTTLYLHFAGKDDILHALIDEGFGRLDAALDAAHATAQREAADRAEALTPLAALGARARAYVAFGRDNPERYEAMFLLHPRHMERYPAALYRRARRPLDRFADLLADATAAGELAIDDPALTASALWAQLHGVVALVLTRRVDVRLDADALAAAVVDGVVRGLPRAS